MDDVAFEDGNLWNHFTFAKNKSKNQPLEENIGCKFLSKHMVAIFLDDVLVDM